MHDTELYRRILGLEAPWSVTEVKLNVKEERVDIWVGHKEGIHWPCPECQTLLTLYDHTEERAWRHLDTCQMKTYLHACPPRVGCKEHGVRQVILPWAEPMSRYTALFEGVAIDVLKECDIQGASRILRLGWEALWNIMDRAVERGLLAKKKRVPAMIGVDEKAIAKGHSYFTLVNDLKRGMVEYIAEDRKQASLDGYFQQFTAKKLGKLQAVAMDMHEPYVQSVLEQVPQGEDKIVFDRFHIMQHMGEAVDKVRRQENRDLVEEGDERLVKTKYLWLYAPENMPEKHLERFDALKRQSLKTSRAWAIKECLKGLWSYVYRGAAERFWRQWHGWAVRSRLQPVLKVARMIRSHLHNILTYCKHRITNAVSEGINSKIQEIKKMACGYRNRDHFKIAIFFHCGGLQLYPGTHREP